MNKASCTFPAEVRLLAKADFNAVFSSGRRLRSGCLTLVWRPNQCGHARLGMAISRKVSRSAVARNRIRRLIRERFRHMRTELPAVDLVLMTRAEAVKLDNSTLIELLDVLWPQLCRRAERMMAR